MAEEETLIGKAVDFLRQGPGQEGEVPPPRDPTVDLAELDAETGAVRVGLGRGLLAIGSNLMILLGVVLLLVSFVYPSDAQWWLLALVWLGLNVGTRLARGSG